ncbi:lysophospholipid acyltransferase family protein [Sediminibacterium soli]|uniref:lysophospholipid acyltransferase family protein n=1 Tax=Sediminibacterium soli TaxID=2698829 RepID=UPI001F2CC552|nr:lysophospholipid acyltransferase family protein [Sediminibacterium soli]
MAMNLLERFRYIRLFRSVVYSIVGALTYPGLVFFNRIRIEGTENLRRLPKKNVLFVSNHQTYFADVIAFIHIFCAVKWRKQNRLGVPYYLLNPFTNVYFVAAEETMNGSWISRFFKMAGALTIKRTWRENGREIQRSREERDTQKIDKALGRSWVITFPQGTTKPFAPGRKGTAYIIKHNQPVVIPVVINGFWRAFNKTGLGFKKKGSLLSIRFKEPMVIDYTQPVEEILDQVMEAIEQSKSYMLRGRHHFMQLLGK